MDTVSFKALLRSSYPKVYKAVAAWTIPDSMEAYEAGERVRRTLKKKGFRDIEDGEDLSATLTECEEWLNEI